MALTAIAVVSTRREVLMSSPIRGRNAQLRKVREDELDRSLGGGARARRDRPDRVEVEQDRAVRGELVVLHRAAEGDLGVVGGAAALLPELAGHLTAGRVGDGHRDELLPRPSAQRVVRCTGQGAGAERATTRCATRVDLGGAAA